MSALLAAIAGSLHPVVSAAPTSLLIVQRVSAGTGTGAASTSQTITLGATPTPGNYLVCLTADYQTGQTVSAPDASWTEWPYPPVSGSPSGKMRTDAFVHKVVSGDGKSFTFTFSSSTNIALALYEVSGTSGVITSANKAWSTTGVTPQQVIAAAEAGGALVLGWFAKQGSADAAAAGWTKDLYIPTSNGSVSTFTRGLSVAGTPTTLTVTDSGTDLSWTANIILLGPAP